MSDQLVQVTQRRGTIDRVPGGQTPVVEMRLAPGQYVVSMELEPHVLYYSDRKTVDWSWTAYIVTPLGGRA